MCCVSYTYRSCDEGVQPCCTNSKADPGSGKNPIAVACQVDNTFWLVAVCMHVSIKGIIAAVEWKQLRQLSRDAAMAYASAAMMLLT